MNTNPLITISIPTYNSEKFIRLCLDAIKNQTYKNIEINIIDGNSKDRTTAIAQEYGATVITYPNALLGARDEGVKVAKGDYVLLLDSDQILERDAIENAVSYITTKNLDMLILEEDVYSKKTFIEKLFHYDRKLIHVVKDFSPFTGVMLPRFYKIDLIRKVFANIDEDTKRNVGGQDHAIIYLEAWNISNKVDLLPHAVKHMEPSSLRVIWKKFYRWGYTSVGARTNKYTEMLTKKEHFRKGMFAKGYIVASFASILLLLIKGVPYKLGYYSARNKEINQENIIRYTLNNKIKFYLNYFFVKVVLLLFEVKLPKFKFYMNELIYSFGKLLPFVSKQLPFKISKVITKYGIFLIRPGTLDQICASPAFEREDVIFLIDKLDQLVKEKNKILFLDIGADFGTYSITVGNRFKKYTNLDIIAFEPTKSSHEFLLKNIKINNLDNVRTYNFALFNKETKIELDFNEVSPGSSGFGGDNKTNNKKEMILAKKLDDISELRNKKYDAVVFKIDVEGVETEVLQGAREFISGQKETYIMVEDFVNEKIILTLHEELKAKFICKKTPYNSWWKIENND